MEINKQLFEDVLSGKLKGTFILENTRRVSSNKLKLSSDFNTNYPYCLNNDSYTNCGRYNINCPGTLDIVDFIPDTDMKENELKITIPEGQEIDWQESAKQEKIVFKKKDTKPRSWEEYCKQTSANTHWKFYKGQVVSVFCGTSCELLDKKDKASVPSKELAEAFLAMMQLMSLRQAWVGDWKPNYYMNMASNWSIEYEPNPGIFSIVNHCKTNGGGLTFPTREMAADFMDCFKDLLKVAKPLI